MQPTGVGHIEGENNQEILRYIFEEAMGNIIELSAAPTATAPLLEDKTVGEYDGTLYWRVGKNIYSITPDSTIAITTDEE